MIRFVFLFAATLLASVLPASATIWQVSVISFEFSPSELTIQQGDTVEWNNTDGFHNVRHICDPSLFGTDPGDAPWTYQFVFNVPVGGYPYVCEIHPEMMRGFIHVEPRGRWDVTVQNFSFTPPDLTITVGDTVVWTNIGGFHNVHHDADPSLFGNSPESDPWVYEFVFNLPAGVYPYFCEVHGAAMMSGTITVLAPAALPAPAALTACPDGTTLLLAWSSVCGATSYRVYRGPNVSANVFPVLVGQTTDTTMADTIASAGSARFYYQVRANNE